MLWSLMYVKGRGVPSYFPLSAGTARLDARNQAVEQSLTFGIMPMQILEDQRERLHLTLT